MKYEKPWLGWGHTLFEHACEAACRAGVKNLLLFHHDPMRSDSQFDTLAAEHCQAGRYGEIRVMLAREGMEIEL